MEAMATSPTTRRFTSDEVWRMVAIGLLEPDEPYELIDGELVHVSPQNPPHARVISELTQAPIATLITPIASSTGATTAPFIEKLTFSACRDAASNGATMER